MPLKNVVGLLGVVLCVTAQAQVYPGASWETRAPEDAGLDKAGLDAMAAFMGGRGCVVRGGYMIYTWGDPTERGDVASAVKPWFTHFLVNAVESGLLSGFDEPAVTYEPRLSDLNAELGYKDRKITFHHFANQTSCYGVEEAPGSAFDYNDWQMALFVDTLFLKVYKTTYERLDDDVLHARLTDRLGCEDDPTFFAFQKVERAGRLAISPRDFARFGLLYLHNGAWRGEQLISPEHARMVTHSPLPADLPRTTGAAAEMCPDQRSLGSEKLPDNQTDHFGSYSWLWWVNGIDSSGKRHWPDAPEEVFAALGHKNGMRGLAVIPSLDLVISWNDTRLGDVPVKANPLNDALRLLVASVRGDGPKP